MKNRWTETHFYDKNISEKLMELVKSLVKDVETMSKEEKNIILQNLRILLLSFEISEQGMRYYDQIVKSYKENKTDNYDPINKLDASVLLCIIYSFSKNNDTILLLLKEQMEDMIKGFCPQGRTIRLLQIISCSLDY